MADSTNEVKKRGRKKGSTSKPRTVGKRVPRNLESLDFEQLQALSITVANLMKTKKDEQIRILRSKLEELERM